MSDAITEHENEPTRRDFIWIATGAMATVGAGLTVWPFVKQLAPAADTSALGTKEVDLAAMTPGQQIQVMWRGQPVFIRMRTEAEIAAARADDDKAMKDPATDASRLHPGMDGALKPQYLIMLAACTHFGCIPTEKAGDWGGWFCPCHGSHYDLSGRIRKGPAPLNLVVPPYAYTSDTRIVLGREPEVA